MTFLDVVHRFAIDIENGKVEFGLTRICGSGNQVVELNHDWRYCCQVLNLFMGIVHTMW